MKTPISYYGGKQTMLRHILPLIPEHTTYTEAYAGGAAVYFAKEPASLEIINDINGEIINFYKALKTRYPELKAKINATLYGRQEHDYASMVMNNSRFFNEIERACAFWVMSKMSFASKLNGPFGYDKSKNSMAKKIVNAKEQFTEALSNRLQNTQIECTNALRVIRSRDTDKTFHFVDPPYINSDCGHYSGTFNLMDFQELLEMLSGLQGKFMLTMFPHNMLYEFAGLYNWKVKEVQRTISASKVKRRKQAELIVMNFDL